MSTFADALAKSGGTPSAFDKYSQPGATVTGTIVDVDMMQTRDFKTQQPETWSDGNPKQQVAITLATPQRDQSDPDDDGHRRIYVKWWGDQKKALIAAIRATGDSDLRSGGTFTATFSREGTSPAPGMSPPKIFTYQYTPPATGIAQAVQEQPAAQTAPAQQAAPVQPQPVQEQGDPWNPPPAPNAAAGWPTQPAPAPAAAPAPAPQPAQQPAPQLAGPGLTTDQVTKLRQLQSIGGLTDDQIAAALGVPVETVIENTLI